MKILQDHYKRTGLEMEQFAKYYGVKWSTMRNWLYDPESPSYRTPPSTVIKILELLQYIEIMNPDLHTQLLKNARD